MKQVDGDTVHCFELDHGVAGKERSFKATDVILVRKGA